ncbi:MAG: uracil-DNA glycosylase [Rhodobacteraceae bacterium]|nr:uracil-DNA glycosylase [Paracoccaceae bacterium]
MIAGQAPGARVHQSGRPFTDPSGDRLRNWMGIGEDTFYDANRIAILPMGFCFPGYDINGSDLPPPAICSKRWRVDILAFFSNIKLTLPVGGYAQKWHLQTKERVDQVVSNWWKYQPNMLPLPHPSWRNNAWIKLNPWFEADLVPFLRQRVQEVLK